ncbi:MAG: hypothetical protein QOC99_2367 [Acidobacteriota bacterium]|nr:hypothetical protein [Acidobacteriota bacterium]
MKTQDSTCSQGGKSKGGRASAAKAISINCFGLRGDAEGSWLSGGACVLQSVKVWLPDLSSSVAWAWSAGHVGINSGMENNSVLRRLLVCALAALVVAGAALPVAAGVAQDKDAQKNEKPKDAQKSEKQKKEEQPQKPRVEKVLTADLVAETVVFVYGSRAGLQQIRRTGVERGKITRTAQDGSPEEISYERTFKRGETFEKDKIRLDQRLSAIQYSIIFSEGRVFGLLRGTSFTPRQEDVTSLLAERVHGIDALLRYKESGAGIKYTGKENQKGLDLWLLDLTDKENHTTRFYISAKTGRVLWLEYEEAAGGASPVKYKRSFHDYRIVQGTLVPYRSVLYAGDRQVEESQVLTVTYGVKMEDSIFSPESASFQQ